jgi:colicin import membrane protein
MGHKRFKMIEFTQKYEVQKGRTVTCLMGVAHAGGILELKNFSGDDLEAKQKMIDALVDIGSLKPVPLSDAEKKALAKAKAEEEARAKMDAEAKKAAEKEAAEKAKAEEEARAKMVAAILSADFDSMNKDPMIEFAKTWEIELKASKADEIREELKELQGTLRKTE